MEVKDKIQCPQCLGVGFVKANKKFCYKCEGKCCYLCDYSGYKKQAPFKECKLCDSSGEILHNIKIS